MTKLLGKGFFMNNFFVVIYITVPFVLSKTSFQTELNISRNSIANSTESYERINSEQ